MAFFDFLKREAKDLGDAAEKAKDRFDQELTKREQELEMTPSEKVAALQEQASTNDAKFDAILEKAGAQGAMADAVADVESLPKVTHIVLPDGQVRSGEEAGPAVADQHGTAPEVPLVSAPTTEELQEPPAAAESPTAQIPADTNPVAPPAATAEPAPSQGLPAPPAAATAAVHDQSTPPTPVVRPSSEPPEAVVTSSVESSAAPQGAPTPAPAANVAPSQPSVSDDPTNPDFGKTPAQLKYERARAAANDLLDELREELKDEGDI